MENFQLNIRNKSSQVPIYLTCSIENSAVCELNFTNSNEPTHVNKPQGIAIELERQLNEYFAGVRKVFDLVLTPRVTEFQKVVFEALLEVPYGSTSTYKSIAERINRATAFRAVAQALHRNPIPIIIPCHRIIGNNGKLVGYAGGVPIKERLLLLEKIV